MSATKQKSSAGKNVLIFFIVFIILEMLIIFGISRLFKNKDSIVSVIGYSFYIMDNGNMGDDVPKGTLVAASESYPTADEAGKALLCKNVDGVGSGVFRLSEVVPESEGKDGVIYKVYQNNDKTKFYDIKSDNIVGIASTHLKTAGKVIVFVRSKFGMIVCAGAPLFLLIILEIIIAVATHTPKSKNEEEYEEETEQEDVQLDDFLFGGKDEGEQIAKRRKMIESREKENSNETDENETVTEEQIEAVSASATADEANEAAETDSEDENVNADIDRSYYEKASQLLDSDSAQEEAKEQTLKEEPAKETARKLPKPATASLEDLMKLMEQEQDKLKKQLNKNQPKQ